MPFADLNWLSTSVSQFQKAPVLWTFVAGLALLPVPADLAAQSQLALATVSSPNRVAATPTRAVALVDSVVVYSRRGASFRVQRGVQLTGVYEKMPHPQSDRSVAELAAVGTSPAQRANWSPQVARQFARTLQLSEALGAPTRAEFRDRISKLPITARTWSALDQSGVTTTRRDYYVAGFLKLSLFVSADYTGGDKSGSVSTSGSDAPDASFAADSSATPIRPLPAQATYCQFTDPWNELWTGECAAQEDLDAMAVAVAVADADVEDAQAELYQANIDMDADLADYCVMDPDEDMCLYVFQPGQPALQPRTGHEPFGESTPGASETTGCTTDARVVSCGEQLLSGIGARVAFFGARWLASSLLAAATVPPAGAVAVTMGLIVTTTFAVVVTTADYAQCKAGV